MCRRVNKSTLLRWLVFRHLCFNEVFYYSDERNLVLALKAPEPICFLIGGSVIQGVESGAHLLNKSSKSDARYLTCVLEI